jgi:hypothetical protein
MSSEGTAAYDGLIPGANLPPLVERAVDLARRQGFANSCRPEHGRLLHALAAGAGQVDQARMHWLTHPALDAAELRLAPDLADLVATRRFPANQDCLTSK